MEKNDTPISPSDLGFFISKVCSDHQSFLFKNKRYKVYNPNSDLIFEAEEIYREAYYSSDKLLEDEDVYEFLIEKDLWTEKEEEWLKEIPTHINEWKLNLYQSFFRENQRNQVRKYLAEARKRFNKLVINRYSLEHITRRGNATFAKENYIIENTTFVDGKKCDWSDITTQIVSEKLKKNLLTDEQIRYIARNPEWITRIKAAEKNNSQVIKGTSSDMSEEQKKLFYWTTIYQNVRESPEQPEDSVIEDDDCFEGFLIAKHRERQNQEKDLPIGHAKIKDAEEVFMFVDSIEDARRVDSYNSPEAKRIKESRIKTIMKKGTAIDADFADVKMKRRMQKAQQR